MGIYAVGDIHGHLDKLESLINKLPLTTDDRLIFLGDYIDRGPDSMAVVEYLLRLGTRFDCVFLMGNHEHMLRDHLAGGINYPLEAWKCNGGIETLISYREAFGPVEMPIPQEHIDFLTQLPYYHLEPGNVFVHGGLKSGEPIARNTHKDFLWPRSAFTQSHYRWPEGIVVYGHTPLDEPLVEPNKIGIDTGCAYGGPLTAVKLPEVEFYQSNR